MQLSNFFKFRDSMYNISKILYIRIGKDKEKIDCCFFYFDEANVQANYLYFKLEEEELSVFVRLKRRFRLESHVEKRFDTLRTWYVNMDNVMHFMIYPYAYDYGKNIYMIKYHFSQRNNLAVEISYTKEEIDQMYGKYNMLDGSSEKVTSLKDLNG